MRQSRRHLETIKNKSVSKSRNTGGSASFINEFEHYSIWIKWIVFIALVIAKIYLVFHHEPWRDETQFLLVLRNEGYWNFLQEFKGYQFPMFEFFSNIFYSIAGYTVFNSQIIAITIASVTSYLILFHLRLPVLISVPLLLGKYMFYEYTVFLNRPYAFAVLLVVIFIYLTIHHKSEVAKMAVLSLLIPGHSLTFIIGCALSFYYIVTRDKQFWQRKIHWAMVAYCCLWFGIAVWALLPRPGGYTGDPLQWRSISETLQYLSLVMNQAFFSFAPVWMGGYSYLFSTPTGLAISGILMVVGLVAFFVLIRPTPEVARQYWALVLSACLVAGGVSFILIFKYANALGGAFGTRHVGTIYIGVMACACLGYFTIGKNMQFRFPVARMILLSICWTVWTLSSICFIKTAYDQSMDDVHRKFAMGSDVADFLTAKGLDKRLINPFPEWLIFSVAVEFPKPQVYRGTSNRENKINDWLSFWRNPKYAFVRPMDEQLKDAFPPEMMKTQKPLVLLNANQGAQVMIGGVLYRQIAAFTGSITHDEYYYIYDVAE
jgi:hypothetical protein